MKIFLILITLLFYSVNFSMAGEVDVVGVSFNNLGGGIYRFDVTLKHSDEGWNHYADKWDVVAPDGTILATRILFHPHVNEQPFTRSLPEVKIPSNIHKVTIQAHDTIHEYGGKTIEVILSTPKTSE